MKSFAIALIAITAAFAVIQSDSFEASDNLVRHFVSFRFKSTVSSDQQREVMNRFSALKRQCVRPGTNTRYIVSLQKGLFNSKEGAGQNMTQGYIVSFSNVKDRDYYVGRPFQKSFDPFHDAFKTFVGPLLDMPGGAFVFDFIDI